MKENRTFRPVPGLSREDEEKQLAEIIGIAQENLERISRRGGQLREELHDLMETYGPKDKEALALFHNTQTQMLENERDLVRCKKARKKPYFGRIDFRDAKYPQDESYYVGRVGISRAGSEPVVIDWRAPLAAVYYENALGPCSYTVQNEGTYEIELKRKRTYEIENDRLKDFFDSDVVANDELLTKYLARNKKAVLGEIIATIQKEQNAIIRKSPRVNLIVQGVAGSGKTTVAMHRISYILYNYEDDFRPQDFYIIGSNRILLNYITSVLPDLDVYGVSQMTMEQLFVRLLYEDWDPGSCRICQTENKGEGIARKGSFSWFLDLKAFCGDYERCAIPGKDVRLDDGTLLLTAEAIRRYLEQNSQLSMQSKINSLNEILMGKLENELVGKYVVCTAEEKKELRRFCRQYFGKNAWKGSIFELYQEFLGNQAKKGKTVPFTEGVYDVYDLAALAYLYKRIKETDGIREVSHVIIDEAQDFGMMAYGALEYCLRGCTYTIMGDVSQNIHFGCGLNDWSELKKLILKGDYDSFGLLKKSYRNTVEISEFATNILRHGNFAVYPVEPINRHGNPVSVTACLDQEDMLLKTEKTIRSWQKAGYETIAVICRDEKEAREVSRQLGKQIPVSQGNPETAEFGSGVMVLPVEYTKGLEFDAVVLYHPSEENYPSEDAYVKLLYVAATRALHELTVVHLGDLTALAGTPAPERRMESLEEEKETAAAGMPDAGRAAKAIGAADAVGTMERKGRERASAAGAEDGKEKLPESGDRPQPEGGRDKGKEAENEKRHGPSVLRLSGTAAADDAPVNRSPHPFLSIPDIRILRPEPAGRLDPAVVRIEKTRKYLDLLSGTGRLRLMPLWNGIIRVQFKLGTEGRFAPGYWDFGPAEPVSWSARAGKNLAELSTDLLTVRIDRRRGSLLFLDKAGKRLMAERPSHSRQIREKGGLAGWVHFDWQKNEIICARGTIDSQLERMNQKARYISFGGKKLRMPLLVSSQGYGIGIAAEHSVICCGIPMYGTYICAENVPQVDYYFLYGDGSRESVMELYKKLV